MATPLAGITVLDFGQIYQGPYATMLIAKAGADVIKIEPPRRRAAA
jgi:CoA:oxalate CoA-transferase